MPGSPLLVAAAMALAGCELYLGPSENESPPDATSTPDAPPDAETDSVAFYWIVAVSPRSDAVTTRINGVRDRYLGTWFENDSEAASRVQVIETVVHDRVVSRVKVHADCDQVCGPQPYAQKKEHWFAYGSGELRVIDSTCDAWAGECVLADSDEPLCRRGTCPAGMRCGLDRVDDDPTLGWLACVPIGTGGEGATCTIDRDGVDDCGSELHCIDGECRPACEFDEYLGEWLDQGDCAVGTCQRVEGTSPEVGVCG